MKKFQFTKTQRVAVIGAGLGGLAAAIRIQSAGIQTTIFEKRECAGGCAAAYKDQDFTFDAGPSVITEPAGIDELFRCSNRRLSDFVDLLPVTPAWRFFGESKTAPFLKKWDSAHVFFPKGGMGALVRALVRLFTELGGRIQTNAPVERILTHAGTVTGIQQQNGAAATFDAVVSNADIVHTARELLARESLAAPLARRMEGLSYGPSIFAVTFGTRKKYRSISHRNVLWLPEDLCVTLNAPTVTDPSLAPEGGESFCAWLPVPHIGKSAVDWNLEGPRLEQKILEMLERSCLPDLNAAIVTKRIFTPADFKTELNIFHGAVFSLEPSLMQRTFFRPRARHNRIGGLYFVGAGTHPGAGVTGVIASAKGTARLVIDDLTSRDPDGTEPAPVPIPPFAAEAG